MVSIIIPVYFCDPSLYSVIDRCFKSIENEKNIELIAIDDSSPLPLPSHWPIRHHNPYNLGFTATVNRGLELSSGKIIVVMNDDIVMVPECMDRFRELTGTVIASPADTSSSDDDRFGSCWGMTRNAYLVMGHLDERMRHFFSDLGYYERAQAFGVEVRKWHDIILEHPESSTYNLLDKEALLEADSKAWFNV